MISNIAPMLPGAPTKPEDFDPLPPNQPPPALPDVLEAALAAALSEYRFRAEEILDTHRDMLESMEASHALELASLRAENEQLRAKLGIAKPPGLFQTVVFEAGDHEHQDHGNKRKKKPANFEHSMDVGTVKRGIATPKDMSRQVSPSVQSYVAAPNGGSWQQFVAWVPSGAALQKPEPWKGLTEAAMESAGDEEAASEKEDESIEGEFKVLETWHVTEEEKARAARRKRRAEMGGNRDDVSEFATEEQDEDDLFQQEDADRCALHPHSRTRSIWDMTSLIMVVYDMVMIPMIFFDLPDDSDFLLVMQWSTRMFWSLDMIVSCVTGIVMPDGNIRLSIAYSIRRYVKTWLALDLIIVGSDWGSFILTSTGGAGTVGRFTRVFRAVRAVRLLRLARMREVIDKITERVQSDKIAFGVSVMKLVVFIVATGHLYACLWWAVGTVGDETSWVIKYEFKEATLDKQYLMSLHWALSQYSGGMEEVTPEGLAERLYAIGVWIFTFMTAAIVVSSITSSLTQMHIVGGSTARQMATLRKYLKQNSISSNLALRMQRSAQHAMSGDLTPDLVELLQVVSEPLRVEMHYEIYADLLKKHMFFCDLMIESPLVMRRVCHFATTTLFLSAGEVLFSEGEAPSPPRMYFVVRGSCEYLPDMEEPIVVGEGQWLSEACLWANWVYKGTLTAVGDVKIAAIEAKTFQEVLSRFHDSVQSQTFDPKQYAEKFVRYINSLEDPNDLSVMRSC